MRAVVKVHALKVLTSVIFVLGCVYAFTQMLTTPVYQDSYPRTAIRERCEVSDCDPAFMPDFESMFRSKYAVRGSSAMIDPSEKFTVLMLTYDRFFSFRQVVNHYACMSMVDRLVLLWSYQDLSPPNLNTFDCECPEKLVIKWLASRDITRRFSSFAEIRTEAILNIDDDMLLSKRDIYHAFKVWKRYPWGIVGPFPRSHNGYAAYLEYAPNNVEYSLILTSTAFLHREYLRMFDETIPADIRREIDSRRNCEDILMNFVVKQHCRCSGVFAVKYKRFTEPRRLMTFRALSGRSDHYTYRSECLRTFSKLFGRSVNLTKSYCLY